MRPLTRPQFATLTALGVLALALVGANGSLFLANRAAQDEIAARGAMVQQTVPLEALQRDIARTLADLALRSQDRQVLDMLAANNITVTANAAANGSPNAPAAPAAAPTPSRP